MGEIIHARRTPDGFRFRLWNTFSDRYVCDPLTEREFLAFMEEYTIPHRLNGGTIVEAQVGMAGAIAPGMLGIVEGDYRRVGLTTVSVMWYRRVRTVHPISIKPGTQLYQIDDPSIRILGTLSDEQPFSRMLRAKNSGSSQHLITGDTQLEARISEREGLDANWWANSPEE